MLGGTVEGFLPISEDGGRRVGEGFLAYMPNTCDGSDERQKCHSWELKPWGHPHQRKCFLKKINEFGLSDISSYLFHTPGHSSCYFISSVSCSRGQFLSLHFTMSIWPSFGPFSVMFTEPPQAGLLRILSWTQLSQLPKTSIMEMKKSKRILMLFVVRKLNRRSPLLTHF